jgi:flagellar hook-associated protein 2
MAISSPGLGSGLDINGIVSSLIAAEEAPTTNRLDQKESTFQAKISALGMLKSSLSSFQSSLTTLKDITSFQKRTTSSTDSTLVAASANESASEGSYSVSINRLAQIHKLGSAEHLDTATFGGGAADTLVITVGTKNLTIDLSTAKTLAELNTAINSAADSAGVGVTSTIITGDGGIEKVTLTADSAGYDNRVQIGGTIGGVVSETVLGLATLNTDADGVPLPTDAELDAQIVVDGLTLTRSTNSVSDVISGVTLNLKEVTTSPETISVSLNTGSIKTAVNSFVDNYNKLMATMDELSAVDTKAGTRSVLLGDVTLRAVEYALRNELSNTVSGVSGSFNSLSSIGITTQRDGSVKLDSAVLDKAIDDNFNDIGQLFASSDGVANRFDSLMSAYASSSGIINTRIEGINTSIDEIGNQREVLARRLAKLEARYFSQFSAMDLMVSQLQATSTYLTGALDNLPGSTFKKK